MESPAASNNHVSPEGDTGSNRRHRIKHACEPCKKRKRRCDGDQPCATCVRYDYKCYFEAVQRKRRSRQPDGLPSNDAALGGTPIHFDAVPENEREAAVISGTSPREVNASVAIAQLLRKRLEPRQTDQPQRTMSWNLGMSEERQDLPSELTRIITKDQMIRLSESYFGSIHQLYGFLNREAFHDKVEERWQMVYEPDPWDSILCGVAALGSQFLGEPSKSLEMALVDCAKRMLEITSASSTPSFENAASWVLRTIYLRSTTQPYTAWITSCTAMLTIDGLEMVGESDDESENGIISTRRLFWCASVLNTWVSNEYGRSKVEVSKPLPAHLISRPGDFTPELLYLYKISERLDPQKPTSASDFEAGIAELATFKPPVDGLFLSQSNLALALYRRLRFVSSTISDETIRSVITMGNTGLDAVLRLIRLRQPWWHVANVPFQFICTLLVIDTEEALEHLARAVDTLQAVGESFPTRSLTETLAMVRKLIQLACKQKRGQLNLLEHSLAPRPLLAASQQPKLQLSTGQDSQVSSEWADRSPASTEFSDFDWEKFFSMDVSVLEYPT
ncbi:transcription factor Cys [Marssonina coronariae]|uniref:Transcription factor Cys n=1 Tax=Diplocarpon coronariae TaxID=2795749 RepID=A0A218YUT8_9HELO|nr:transcription factor Cys [Marssonina coronariae]